MYYKTESLAITMFAPHSLGLLAQQILALETLIYCLIHINFYLYLLYFIYS